MKSKVVIVAGGLGTRMKPIGEQTPKCLLELKNKPLLEHQIKIFKKKGYTDFIFCVGHLGEKIKEHFKDGSSFGVTIQYSKEPKKLLGTAGAVKLIEKSILERCIVFYGDNITTIDFDNALKFHISKKSILTVIVRDLPVDYKSSNLITLDHSNRIDFFLESPAKKDFEKNKHKKKYINNGIYILEKEVFGFIPKEIKFDFAKQLIPKLISKKLRVHGFISKEFFREIGTTKKYNKIKKEINQKGFEVK